MSGYLLTRTARTDLLVIRSYYLENAGYEVARNMASEFTRSFQFLGRTPGAGHQRKDLTEDASIRFWPMRDFLIVYRAAATPVEILFVVRGSRNIPDLLLNRMS